MGWRGGGGKGGVQMDKAPPAKHEIMILKTFWGHLLALQLKKKVELDMHASRLTAVKQNKKSLGKSIGLSSEISRPEEELVPPACACTGCTD